MTRAAITLLACLPLMVLTVAAPARGQDILAAPQKLYLEAQYEDALNLLDQAKADTNLASETALRVEQLRALCLLALDRKADAQQAIEAILDLDPLYRLGEDDAAPKIRTAFREVRRRALPAALERVYSRAKQAYERKSYTEAVAGFTRVRALLDDADLTLSSEARTDMAMVARGFLDLAEAAAAPPPPSAIQPPAPAVPTSAPSSTPPRVNQAAPSPPGRPLYDAASAGVTPPSPVRTDIRIPDSMKPSGSPREAVVEIVVGVNGSVESATIRQPAGSPYDALVVQAAGIWRYRPATRGGTPVRFRLLVRIVIPPRG